MGAGIEFREAHFPGRAPIEAYGNGGFRFAGMSHRGSILFLPSGIREWTPGDPPAVADFDRVLEEAGNIEILLIGFGRELRGLGPALRERFRAAGIAADPMTTGAAVRTLNVLLAEERAVAAALVAVD